MSIGKSLIKLDGPEGASRLEEYLKNNNCMIRFHMYGCMWCNKMEPEWKKLADRLSNKDITVLDVDSEAVSNMKSGIKSTINGYPTIVYSPRGMSDKFTKFDDESGRTAENMEQWLNTVSRNLSKSKKLKSRKSLKRKTRKSIKSLQSKLGGSRKKRQTHTKKNKRQLKKY